MSIPFHCEQCGQPAEVDEGPAGNRRQCQHCGASLTVPVAEPPAALASLRLRPLESDDPVAAASLLHATHPDPQLRATDAEPDVKVEGVSAPPRADRQEPESPPYEVLAADNDHELEPRSPIPRGVVFLRAARFISGELLSLRNWLYVVSVLFLVIALCGFLFKWPLWLRLGAVGVVLANAGMFLVGLIYLISLPFKEGPLYGLANLFPPYAVYYWATRWPRMRGPVLKTLSSFTPILLVALAYLCYKEAPVVERAVEDRLPAVEQKLDETLPSLGLENEPDTPPESPAIPPQQGRIPSGRPGHRRSLPRLGP